MQGTCVWCIRVHKVSKKEAENPNEANAAWRSSGGLGNDVIIYLAVQLRHRRAWIAMQKLIKTLTPPHTHLTRKTGLLETWNDIGKEISFIRILLSIRSTLFMKLAPKIMFQALAGLQLLVRFSSQSLWGKEKKKKKCWIYYFFPFVIRFRLLAGKHVFAL